MIDELQTITLTRRLRIMSIYDGEVIYYEDAWQ